MGYTSFLFWEGVMPWKECSVMDERLQFVARRLGRIPGGEDRRRVHPLARVLISLASFSISSVFRSMATESTRTESVFSTSAFNSLARS